MFKTSEMQANKTKENNEDLVNFIKSSLKDELIDDISDEDLFTLIKAHKKYLKQLKEEKNEAI